MGPYRDFVMGLDPTRPTMRTGDTGTAENLDLHTCRNTIWTDEGDLPTRIDGWVRQARGRTLTNTEYMNIFERPICQWTGVDDPDADRLVYAQLGMEHTEAMRRARLDGIWPYMYAGWTRTRRAAGDHGGGKAVWKAGFAQPVSAAWHSALSPVLASLDLFDPNYLTGQEMATDLYLINDSWHDAEIHVDLLLTAECPEFIPEADCFDRPLAGWSFDFELKADTLAKTPVGWRLPEEAGNYWLTARTTGISGRPVLSQRFVRAVEPPEASGSAKERILVLLGGDSDTKAYFESKGLRVSGRLDALRPGEHTAIVWDAARLTDAEKQSARSLCEFAAGGGRVAVLGAKRWNWHALCDIAIEESRPFSRVFAYEGATHAMLSGIDPAWLMRWNGLPGTVATAALQGPAMEGAEKILWASDTTSTVVAEIPAATGGGSILFSQLDIRRHLDRTKPGYDPVAERIMLNLLER